MERRIEKRKLKNRGGGGRVGGGSGLWGRVRVDVNEELKLLCKCKKWGVSGPAGDGGGRGVGVGR